MTKHILTVAFFFVTLLSVSFVVAQDTGFLFLDLDSSKEELRRIIEKVEPSIVSVIAYDETGTETDRGSGFFIDFDGNIMTNAHVIKGAYSAEVVGSANSYEKVSLVKVNENLDLAVIQVQDAKEPVVDFDHEYTINPGDRVFVIGKDKSFKDTFSEGSVDLIIKQDDSFEYIKINRSVSIVSYPDSTDGPLLNSTGKVIGITRTIISDHPFFDQTISMTSNEYFHALNLDAINSFLSEQAEIIHLNPAKSRIWFSWIKNKIKSFAIAAFITLYQTGFQKIMMVILAIVAFISLIQWLFIKIKKRAH